MGLLQTLGIYLLYAAVLLAILPFTSYYKNYKEREANLTRLYSGTPFFIAHVLDPSVDGLQHTSWTNSQWRLWSERRETMHAKANTHPKRTPLTSKGLNTVLITTATEFHDAFVGRSHSYSSRGWGDDRNTFWTETPFSSFIFTRQEGKFRVYKCPPMYVAVKFVEDKPVHMPITARSRNNGEVVKLSKDCVVVA